MHVKRLTLRGFKSFASTTALRLEPGITCVVGPNGSGKSNVVDALAWVMGEQGAKSLRGGKMEDVVFAGTARRAPLGRAEAVLDVDNTDGALPIDYSEVTISRTMFRSGGSEYAINGDPCRLLDVQELLSDAGIGREMHVIVGQGQLDTVLRADPQERRSLIEEAAGILKHRKRKEKALRKLDAMQGNLTRLQDLVAELRRQLGPLGKQAELARRAAAIQADLRDARLRLLADDIAAARAQLEEEQAGEAALRERRAAVDAQLTSAKSREAELDTAARSELPNLTEVQDTWYQLSSLRERLRATEGMAAQRHRHLSAEPEDEQRGSDPERVEHEAAEVRERERALGAELETAQETLAGAVRRRSEAETALQEEEQRIAAAARAAADRRENLAKLRGQRDAARSRVAAGEDELGRLSSALEDARQRAEQAQQDYRSLEGEIAAQEEGEVGLDEEHEAARAELVETRERLDALRGEDQEAGREHAALAARKEGLEVGLAQGGDAAETLLAAGDQLSGLLGSVAPLVAVEPGAERAIAAALGDAADALAVSSAGTAVEALRLLKEREGGRTGLVVGGGSHEQAGAPLALPVLPAGARRAGELVSGSEEIHTALQRTLDGVVVVEDLEAARSLVDANPQLRAVTRDGDLLGSHWAHGGSTSSQSLLEVQAAVDEADERLRAAAERCDRVRARLAGAREEEGCASERVEAALAKLHDSDARMNAVAEQLGQLGSASRAAAEESERLTRAIADADKARDRDRQAVAGLERRLAEVEAVPADAEQPATDTRDRLAEEATAARTAETEARLAVRTAEERARALTGRADQLERSAADERAARERAAQRRRRRGRQAAAAQRVVEGCGRALPRLEASLEQASAEREAAEEARAARENETHELRAHIRDLSAEQEKLVDRVHSGEVARAERRLRLEQMEARAVDEFGVEVETLIADYGPDAPVPPAADAGEDAEPEPYVRKRQEKRAKDAEKSLEQLGKVNPLALEEYAALEERHRFLTGQLEDLKATERDLLTVVKEVDDRVQHVFGAAFADTAREFERVFGRLFPGGEGRLVLTDPDDLLASGVEVEARPPGKRVKRLSLLSGGERSLTAVAVLIAIFKARPSPFYVLDEVEATLDDTNLQRLLTVFEELRERSQLLVVTHQKRTMEVADALYGVSMSDDGISTVISQRLRDRAPTPAAAP